MAGSNWLPAHRRSSASASGFDIASRYARSVVIALYASQAHTIRASTGTASPTRPSG
jgi:hypothetical protein